MKPAVSNDLITQRLESWKVANDDVMGGLSKSQLSWNSENNSIRFEGALSLENNGGFASIKSLVKKSYFAGAAKICIDVKGDGREYQFRLRDNCSNEGYAYVTKFKTQRNCWQRFCFLPADFSAQFRGRILSDIPPPKFANIKQLGFLLADKNESYFKLDISFIFNQY